MPIIVLTSAQAPNLVRAKHRTCVVTAIFSSFSEASTHSCDQSDGLAEAQLYKLVLVLAISCKGYISEYMGGITCVVTAIFSSFSEANTHSCDQSDGLAEAQL